MNNPSAAESAEMAANYNYDYMYAEGAFLSPRTPPPIPTKKPTPKKGSTLFNFARGAGASFFVAPHLKNQNFDLPGPPPIPPVTPPMLPTTPQSDNTAGKKRVANGVKNNTPKKKARYSVFPTRWEEMCPADKLIINLKREGKEWVEIEREVEKIGDKFGDDGVRKRWYKLDPITTIWDEDDYPRLVNAVRAVDVDIERAVDKLKSEKWTRVLIQMKRAGCVTDYKQSVMEWKLRQLKQNGMIDMNGQYIPRFSAPVACMVTALSYEAGYQGLYQRYYVSPYPKLYKSPYPTINNTSPTNGYDAGSKVGDADEKEQVSLNSV